MMLWRNFCLVTYRTIRVRNKNSIALMSAVPLFVLNVLRFIRQESPADLSDFRRKRLIGMRGKTSFIVPGAACHSGGAVSQVLLHSWTWGSDGAAETIRCVLWWSHVPGPPPLLDLGQ